jgi:glycosyltransferase involved in cell wall biosynthesis
MVRFTLICGTAGRTRELDRLLRSLAAQSYRQFDFLLIDQNTDDRAERILASFPEIAALRLHSPPGLCRALNLGLRNAAGDVIGFPDDDCWYQPDFLQQLANLFDTHPGWDGITVPTADEQGRRSICRWPKSPGSLTKTKIGLCGCSTSVFYRSAVCKRVGNFDESIGAGASLLNPGSDVDYLHRGVRAGFHLEYQPQLVVGHPQNLPTGIVDQQGKRKRYQSAYGEGSNSRKYSLPFWHAGALALFPLFRALKHALTLRTHLALNEWLTFQGRIVGWMRTQPAPTEIREPLVFPAKPAETLQTNRGRRQA